MSLDLKALQEDFDPDDMYGRVVGFPVQMKDGWAIGAEFAKSLKNVACNQVVVCGMGGSAIGGDMARSFLGDRLNVPIVSCRDYAVPAYLRDNSLIIMSSYSGNTGETLSAYESVKEGNSTIVAITSGGELESRCRKDSVAVCKIPGGMPPRSALGYSLLPMLQVLRACGVAGFDDAEFDEALAAVELRVDRFKIDAPDNPAVELANSLYEGFPQIYAAPGLLEAMARRWAGQINENAKTMSHWALFSELNHNEIVGWDVLEGLMSEVVVISLEDIDDHEDTRKQTEAMLDIIEEHAGEIVSVSSGDDGRMARLFSTLILGDFVSVYLALLNGVDPTPVDKIDFLKSRLK